jgi:hypothetical protein
MEKILKIIGGTSSQYEALLITNYQQWCEIQSKGNDRILQKIMIDQAINKWYIAELAKLEATFLKKTASLQHSKYINYSLMKRDYLFTIQLIRRIYPKPLLDTYSKIKPQLTTFNSN